jgi:hypothetical protein
MLLRVIGTAALHVAQPCQNHTMDSRSLPFATAAGLVVVLAGIVDAQVRFTSTWAAPDARTVTFKGKKVAAIVISEDLSLRMSAEEALSRELTARGMQGVAAYRTIPTEELKNVDRAKAWLQREAVSGVVTLRPVSQSKEKRPQVESMWTTPYYSTLWGYYPYSWGVVYHIGSPGSDTFVVVESLIFNVATGNLVWGGVSEAKNPETLQRLVADIVKEAGEKIQKQFR